MDKAAAIDSFFEVYGLTELQISTILKSFEKENKLESESQLTGFITQSVPFAGRRII